MQILGVMASVTTTPTLTGKTTCFTTLWLLIGSSRGCSGVEICQLPKSSLHQEKPRYIFLSKYTMLLIIYYKIHIILFLRIF